MAQLKIQADIVSSSCLVPLDCASNLMHPNLTLCHFLGLALVTERHGAVGIFSPKADEKILAETEKESKTEQKAWPGRWKRTSSLLFKSFLKVNFPWLGIHMPLARHFIFLSSREGIISECH